MDILDFLYYDFIDMNNMYKQQVKHLDSQIDSIRFDSIRFDSIRLRAHSSLYHAPANLNSLLINKIIYSRVKLRKSLYEGIPDFLYKPGFGVAIPEQVMRSFL